MGLSSRTAPAVPQTVVCSSEDNQNSEFQTLLQANDYLELNRKFDCQYYTKSVEYRLLIEERQKATGKRQKGKEIISF